MKRLGKYLETKEINSTVKELINDVKIGRRTYGDYYDAEFDCNCVFLNAYEDYNSSPRMRAAVNRAFEKLGTWVFVANCINERGSTKKYLKICWEPETTRNYPPVPERYKHIPAKSCKKHYLHMIKKQIAENAKDDPRKAYVRIMDGVCTDVKNYLEYRGVYCTFQKGYTIFTLQPLDVKQKTRKKWFGLV